MVLKEFINSRSKSTSMVILRIYQIHDLVKNVSAIISLKKVGNSQYWLALNSLSNVEANLWHLPLSTVLLHAKHYVAIWIKFCFLAYVYKVINQMLNICLTIHFQSIMLAYSSVYAFQDHWVEMCFWHVLNFYK